MTKEKNRGEAPRLVVMLTCNDMTVENAETVFHNAKDAGAMYWGMKEEPLPLEKMKSLYDAMKRHGVTTVLEVVSYDEEGGLRGARIAAECGVDILMGTKFHDSIAKFCNAHHLRYFPFIGTIEGRPSVLTGSIEEMLSEANYALSHGADGIDLLGYRYQGDAKALNDAIVKGIEAPVCLAGSIDSLQRLDEVGDTNPWGFTIGSAFFNHRFGDDIHSQIQTVLKAIG